MTENLAGRGEGLAGLVRSLLNECKGILSLAEAEIAETAGITNLNCLKRRIAELETALEAAAPAGTAPTISMQHPVGEPFIMLGRATDLLDRAKEAMECDPQRDEVGSDCWIWCHQVDLWLTEAAALATPSPQAPAGDLESLAATFHAIYQSEARRQGDVRHKDAYADLPENVKEFDRVLARYVLLNFEVPAATQEPAGSGALTVEEEHAQWHEQNGITEPGSPRKVGEDGARMLASEHLRPQNLRFRIARAMAPVLPDEELRLEAANLAALSVNAALLEAARPSSVPVGEQKQEEGV